MKMEGKRVLIVGGGMIALQKLVGLLNTDAQITILAPTIIDEVVEIDLTYICRCLKAEKESIVDAFKYLDNLP